MKNEKNELILTSSEVEDLAVCVDCGFQECMDCLRNKAKRKLKEAAIDKGDVSNGIAPIADAVPVVRCRECIHYEMGVCLKIYDDGAASSYAWQDRNPDDFCSYGERKEGTSNGIYK